MTTFWLTFTLISDAAFGRGDGIAGLLDAEVQQDPLGFPYLGGKTLKGLVMAETAEILAALESATSPAVQAMMREAAGRLFGQPGSSSSDTAILHFGNAQLPESFRQAAELNRNVSPEETLYALTSIRRQTAMAPNGAPLRNSLRTIRVILRETPFEAKLDFLAAPADEDLGLLAASVMGFRRAGAHRHRGLGRLKSDLLDSTKVHSLLPDYFARFERQVKQ